jgi:nucleotide-binding universal stress UspA family protein
MKVLLPVDGSEHTKRMLGYLAANDGLRGESNEYTAFTVIPALPPRATHFIDQATIEDYYREQAELVLAPVRAFAVQKGWKLEAVHVHGHAAERIAAYARENKFGLIVMGTHGNSALGNMILGSVATGVLGRCTVPVLLVR